MKRYQITPERKAHLYALMAWSDRYTKEKAEEIAYTTEYSELNSLTYAEDSIITGLDAFVEMFSAERLVSDDKSSPKDWDIVIKILVKIHNKWVDENARKYDRGNEEKSNKNLFQHLPTALIGIDELAKDLMFVAPYLEEIGLNAGEMELVPYGKVKPSEDVIKAYYRFVEKYKRIRRIETVEDLSRHIEDCVNGSYGHLVPVDAVSEKRVEYMQRHIGLLVQSVVEKNEECFGMLPMSTEVKF